MFQKVYFTLFVLLGVLISASCRPNQPSPTPEAGLPNPASVFCEQNGGTLELVEDASGGVAGVCVFSDGSRCDEWAYYRGECQPGSTPVDTVPSDASLTPTGEAGIPAWKIFNNEELGYSFQYPADATLTTEGDPVKNVNITGPLVDNEQWPQIIVSHPSDREEFLIPEGVDLLQWLTGHNLLGEGRQPDEVIARTTAIHFRQERSPQSYAFDRYYFVKSGQLYMILIGHAGDKEDWELYNRFLHSIQFEE